MRSFLIPGGIFALVFFVFHMFFCRLFDWKNELEKLTSLNRGVMQVLNLCLMLVFLVIS